MNKKTLNANGSKGAATHEGQITQSNNYPGANMASLQAIKPTPKKSKSVI